MKLHRSVVLAELTGMRTNFILEIGCAMGRCLPKLVKMKEGSSKNRCD